MSTFFITGFNNKNLITLYPLPEGGARGKIDGSCGVSKFMSFPNGQLDSATLFGEPTTTEITIPKRVKLIFNEISDPDSHSNALDRCEELCAKSQLPVINHPKKIKGTTRERVAESLQGIPHLTIPKTIRFTPTKPTEIYDEIERSSMGFPVILRTAGSHGGKTSMLIEGTKDIDKLHIYAYDGSDFYLTAYVDYVSDDGLYRKYRIAVIGGVPIFRHHLVSDTWMIHASSEQFMSTKKALMAESKAKRLSFDSETLPLIRPAIDEITNKLGLEYYGIDCSIDDNGNMLIFEVNANMNILYNPVKALDDQLNRIKRQIRLLIKQHAIDTSTEK